MEREQRERFEKWFKRDVFNKPRDFNALGFSLDTGGNYRVDDVRKMFTAWQAALSSIPAVVESEQYVCASKECEYPDCSCACDGRGPIRPVATLKISSNGHGGITRIWGDGPWQELPDGTYYFKVTT